MLRESGESCREAGIFAYVIAHLSSGVWPGGTVAIATMRWMPVTSHSKSAGDVGMTGQPAHARQQLRPGRGPLHEHDRQVLDRTQLCAVRGCAWAATRNEPSRYNREMREALIVQLFDLHGWSDRLAASSCSSSWADWLGIRGTGEPVQQPLWVSFAVNCRTSSGIAATPRMSYLEL